VHQMDFGSLLMGRIETVRSRSQRRSGKQFVPAPNCRGMQEELSQSIQFRVEKVHWCDQ
jgi:hypothetical protein